MSTQTEALRPTERTRRYRALAIVIVTNLISVVCLGWVLSGAGLHHIWGEVQHMRWSWVCLAIVCDICVYLLQGWRWKLILRPIFPVSFARSVEAIYVGLFANEVLPLRAGELIRCFLLSRSTRIPISITFASALIERIFDGIWLTACFFFVLHMGRLPAVLQNGGYVVGLIVVVCGIALAYLMYAKRRSAGKFLGFSRPGWFNTLIEDLHLIGHSRYLYFAFLISGAYLLAQMLPIYMLMRANTLQLHWTASFILMVLLRLSSVVPQAPGNIGSFQWVTAATLINMFGLASGHAKRFSLILWAVVTLPLLVFGFIALTITGLKMSHLQREAKAAATAESKRRALWKLRSSRKIQ